MKNLHKEFKEYLKNTPREERNKLIDECINNSKDIESPTIREYDKLLAKYHSNLILNRELKRTEKNIKLLVFVLCLIIIIFSSLVIEQLI